MVVLVILIMLTIAAPYVYQLFRKDTTINVKDFNAAVALLDKGKQDNPDNGESGNAANAMMFRFDPNNLPTEKWKQLGLGDEQAAIIKHYQDKGGHFYKKEDLQKIYSITPEDYKRLEPFIALPGGKKAGGIIELNSADSIKLTELPGIGASFAKRIINYRQRLGGFYKKDQLKEVFGMDQEKFESIRNQVTVNPKKVTKIHINKVDFDGLSHFPYLSFKQMNAIIQYRDQHGDYETIDDLHNIAILDNVILRKIEPYLSFK